MKYIIICLFSIASYTLNAQDQDPLQILVDYSDDLEDSDTLGIYLKPTSGQWKEFKRYWIMLIDRADNSYTRWEGLNKMDFGEFALLETDIKTSQFEEGDSRHFQIKLFDEDDDQVWKCNLDLAPPEKDVDPYVKVLIDGEDIFQYYHPDEIGRPYDVESLTAYYELFWW